MASEIDALVASWKRDLKARNLAERTVDSYGESTAQFSSWLAEHAPGVDSPADVTWDHVAGFITHLIETRSASTASVRYRALQQFFNWLVDEEELDASPMTKMQPPMVPEKPVPVLSDEQFKALFATCAGKTFMDRRDAAILRLFAATGVQLAEMANLTLDDVHLDDAVAVVLGKGRRPKTVPFGKKTTRTLDRYLRERSRHKRADEPALWLGISNQQAMTHNGITQMVRRRGKEAGIDGLHPHMLHHFASNWLHGRPGGRPDAAHRLEGQRDGVALRRVGRRPAGQGRPPPHGPRRPVLRPPDEEHPYGDVTCT